VASSGVRLGQVESAGGALLWLEGRPTEGGRSVIVRRAAGGHTADVTAHGFDVRSRVHEYGGGAYLTHGASVIFSRWDDQRLYRKDPGQEPRAITPDPPAPAALRYADGRVTPDGAAVVCVRERHSGSEVVNELVRVPLDGSAEPIALASGHDFYSFPRPSPDGTRLAFSTWDHPNMPWDGTDLWVAAVGADGSLEEPERVAGGPSESVFQPAWSPDGVLHFISDRSGWWNLYRLGDRGAEPLAPLEAEFGVPQWNFGAASYAFLPDGRIACSYGVGPERKLGILDGELRALDLAHSPGGRASLTAVGDRVAYLGVSPTEPTAIVIADPDNGESEVVRAGAERSLDAAWISVPRPVEFASASGATAHALFYPPRSPEADGPEGERPPLVVMSHGGPTAAAERALDLEVQFFTSRGIGVVDVDYGGSTGYGRAYRERLKGQWGIVDTEDCIAAALHLAGSGDADAGRLAIRGGSAGGYTTLCALTFHDVFSAGASYYGVADAETLAQDTHKFESRYLDGLIGPYPERADLYRERSPIHFVERLSAPLIILQGLEDEVVPPSQAATMVEALRARGVPFAYLAFDGEQHGFRRAETVRRALEAEAYFYGRVLGFELADPVEPVVIENLPERAS